MTPNGGSILCRRWLANRCWGPGSRTSCERCNGVGDSRRADADRDDMRAVPVPEGVLRRIPMGGSPSFSILPIPSCSSHPTDPMRAGDASTRLPVALEARRIFAMFQTLDVYAAVDYDRTLILAIEPSSKNWVVAAQVPSLPKAKARRAINPTVEADGRH